MPVHLLAGSSNEARYGQPIYLIPALVAVIDILYDIPAVLGIRMIAGLAIENLLASQGRGVNY
jgi:hypothetical protein